MKIIEFLGMPRTGKTTQIKKLCDYLKEKGKTFELITDRDFMDLVKAPIENSFLYNKEFFSLMGDDANGKIAKNPDVLIYDRGFYDQLVWSTDDVLLESCSQEQKEEFDKEFDSYRNKETFIIHLLSPKVVREERHSKSNEFTDIDTVVLADSFLEKLEQSYKDVTNRVLSKVKNYIELDSNKSVDEIFSEIISFINIIKQ
jgi:thymidylate kinase